MCAGVTPDELAERPRVELFVRSLAPETARAEQERVIERLGRLEERGRVRAVDVHVCGACICPSTAAAETEVGQFLLDRFERFESWAEDRGRSLVGFRRRCVDSMVAGETVTGVTFPRMTLAEFADGDLRFVAPSTNSGTSTVMDRIDQIADGDA